VIQGDCVLDEFGYEPGSTGRGPAADECPARALPRPWPSGCRNVAPEAEVVVVVVVVVVAGISAGRLAGQPLADVPGIGARAGGQFRPCRGPARRQGAWCRPSRPPTATSPAATPCRPRTCGRTAGGAGIGCCHRDHHFHRVGDHTLERCRPAAVPQNYGICAAGGFGNRAARRAR